MIDDAVGRIQTALDQSGRKEETVEIFTTDHGDHLGDHRLLFKGAEQYDQITRVPFIWADPLGEAGLVSDFIGQTHDIGTTILERSKIEVPFGMQGQNLFNEQRRDVAFIQYAHQKSMDQIGVPPNIHTVHDGCLRLSVFQDLTWGELYDLSSDPGEFENLWNDPAYADRRAEMMEYLVRAQLFHLDRSPMPTGRA